MRRLRILFTIMIVLILSLAFLSSCSLFLTTEVKVTNNTSRQAEFGIRYAGYTGLYTRQGYIPANSAKYFNVSSGTYDFLVQDSGTAGGYYQFYSLSYPLSSGETCYIRVYWDGSQYKATIL